VRRRANLSRLSSHSNFLAQTACDFAPTGETVSGFAVTEDIMGFFSGRTTLLRYRLIGPQSPQLFGPEHLEALAQHQAGKQRLASADGIEIGWSAGEHIFDTRFDLAKNIINDMLWFCLRVDTMKLPGDLLKAYYQMDLHALSASNPSGHPSARQKREARESARDRLEEEAKDGRYTKRKTTEVVWDRQANELYFGTNSLSNIDRLASLMKDTFGFQLEAITSGVRAYQLAELHQRTRNVEEARPSIFIPGLSPGDVAWVVDEASRDFLGNEFLMWLWYITDAEEDTIKLADNSEVTIMLARSLTLECPRAQTGHETISSDAPTRLPEARRAIAAGKLPRKMGLTIVRHDQQIEFAIQAETLGISAAKFPAPEEEQERARLEARATQLRDLIETVDLMYDAFGQIRFSSDWPKELNKIQSWIQKEGRTRAAG
jgi:hypothetical protein